MKKDRNCMYPTYPMPYMGPNMMPMMPIPNMMPTNNINYDSSDYSTLSKEIASLERRVSNLESLIGNNTTYNNSTYQMM